MNVAARDDWTPVPLRDLLSESDERISLEPNGSYQQVTVRLWGQGAVLRAEVSGTEVAAKSQRLVQESQLILSRIDARNGAVGIVPAALDGAIASNDFPVFNLNRSRILPAYLGWLVRTESFVSDCREASEGTTNRVRLQLDRLLATKILLPPLNEQRSIVARIEELAGKIEEAQGLRKQALMEASQVFPAFINATMNAVSALGSPIVRIRDVEELVTSGPRNFASKYTSCGARFYRAQDLTIDRRISEDGAVWVETTAGSSERAFVREGDILVVITGATIGRSAIVSTHHPPGLVSQHVGLIRVDRSKVNPRFLHYAMVAPAWAGGQIARVKYGQGKPGLSLTNLRDLGFPLPSLREQRRVVQYLDGMQAYSDSLMGQLSLSNADLASLLPSMLERAFKGEL